MLAAGAVTAAVSLIHFDSALELFILVAILGMTLRGMARRWHRRWIEYRELDEKLAPRAICAPPRRRR